MSISYWKSTAYYGTQTELAKMAYNFRLFAIVVMCLCYLEHPYKLPLKYYTKL